MKKNHMMRIASVLLVVILLTTCAISATFAKYTATGSGKDTASVAKWEVKFGDDKLAADTMKFNLFDTITNTNPTAGVAKSVADNVIAPGTKGEFTVALSNASEVAAKYTVAFDTPDNTPLVFTVVDAELTGTMEIGGTANVTIKWEWPFETTNGDAADTAFAGSSVEVGVTVTAEQVD